MEEWWTQMDDDVLGSLALHGAMSPGDLGRRLGLSEGATASLLTMLVQNGKVRICLNEAQRTLVAKKFEFEILREASFG